MLKAAVAKPSQRPESGADSNTGRARCGRVLRTITDFIAEIAVSSQQQVLLETIVVELDRYVREGSKSGDLIPSIELPLAVYAAITGGEDGAIPLAAACALVCLSVGLFDDLADGDRQSHWIGYSAGEINLAAATALSALPPLILTQLDTAPQRRLRLQQILAEGMLSMSAGQQADLSLTGAQEVTTTEVEAAVIGKTGERFATYCRLAATLAGAKPQATALYGALGREIGIARQLISDCHELVIDPECRDLAHGTRTMPIVAHMNRLTGSDRARFLDLLDRARTDKQTQEAVREELRAAHEISRVIFKARLHYGRARVILERVGAREPGRAQLLDLASAGSSDATIASLVPRKPTLDCASTEVGRLREEEA